MILYCCCDLLWATRVKSTADALGIPARPVRSVAMLRERLGDSPVRALLVDLEAWPTALDLINTLRTDPDAPGYRGIRIVAWGPHVLVDRLGAAQAAGADAVLARGAFARQLPDLLKRLHAGEGVASDLHD